MTKKKTIALVEAPAVEEVTPEQDPLADVPADLKQYVTSRWHGKPNYECKAHRYKIVDEAAFRLHLEHAHDTDWLEGVR